MFSRFLIRSRSDMQNYRFLAIVVLLYFCASLPVAIRSQGGSWEGELADWREQQAKALQEPDGWLSLVGLAWLEPGFNTFGSAPDNQIHLPAGGPRYAGVLQLDGKTIRLMPPPGGFPQGFQVDGKPAESQTLNVSDKGDENNPRLTFGTLNMYVISRGDRLALRIKDSKSAAITGFRGLRWFPPNERYRVNARWIPYDPPKLATLSTLVGTRYTRPVPGVAEFVIAGKTHRLEPILEDPKIEKLHFILRDRTSRSTTYGACRFLYTGFPDRGLAQPGQLVLDFNRLENPPCAYTTYATCPLPPPGNRLPIALPAGEKRYHD
ncbi:MAG: DUF1684 domain-containing protein [Pyrinomonadaceae bacterium]